MLPRAEQLVEGLAFFARRRGLAVRVDAPGVAAAIAEAERLAADRPPDEPAALFYACVRRAGAFGVLAADLLPFIARRQAEAVGLVLRAEDVELDILRLRIVLGELTFDDLRAEFARRARPRA